MPRKRIAAFKLVEVDSEGNLYSLFIHKQDPLPLGRWMQAENHPTKGFAERPGWHCTLKADAPHLKLRPKRGRRRMWVRVDVEGYRTFNRPESQGGAWVLAERMRISGILPEPSC